MKTKTFLRLMMAVLLLAFHTQVKADITIFVQASSTPNIRANSYKGVNITASGTSMSAYSSGTALTQSVSTSDGTYYYEVFLGATELKFQIYNSAWTKEITVTSGTHYFYYNDNNLYIDITNRKNASASHYCYIQNNASFSNMYAYTYGNETEGKWPGQKISAVGHNWDGDHDIYYFPVTGSSAPSKVIFHNNSGNQSGNLDFSDGGVYWYGQGGGDTFASIKTSAMPDDITVEPIYSIAGDNSDLFGSGSWSETETSTEMTKQADGTYTWTSPAATTTVYVAFKVVKNHSWTESWPSNNYTTSVPAGAQLVIVFDPSTNTVSASTITSSITRTGKMYAIGEVAGNTWLANQGIEMTSYNDGTVFKLSNVQILAGKCFAFATALGSTEDDWSGLNTYRINSSADGDFWGVTSTMTDRDNPTPLNIVPWSVASTDKPFQMAETANYDITVDLNTNTVTISRRYGALYMFYGDHWKPNAGAGMITYDGNIYTLSDVQLNGGDTFQFATHLSSSENWGEIASYRYGSNAEGTQWIINKADLNKDLSDAIAEGSQKDFKLADDAGGTFRVVVNLTDKVVTLFKMAEVFDGKVIVHLEQTSNVSNPKLWAYDKERLNDEAGTAVHVDRPDRTEISNNRKIIYEGVPNANDTTTVDGRTWWTWELEHPMIDFWFTRKEYEYNRSDLTNDNMTDIVWRSSGELYLSWPDDSNTPEDYTRDYYAAAAHEAASSAVMIEGHLYVYFTNTPGWEYVFCHAWYTDEAGENHDLLTPPSPYEGDPVYPGALCELVGYDSDGYSVWRMDLTAAGVTITPNGILFNNGIDNHHNYATGENNAGVTEQSSDNEFHNGTCYDYCGVVTTGNSLASLISNGVVNGPVYTVQDDLIGVYLDRNATTTVTVDGVTHTLYGALYCKDKNNFLSTPNVEKSLQKEGEIDYMKENFVSNNLTIPSRYDQSNWVKLVISTQYPGYTKDDRTGQLETLEQYVGYVLPGGTVRAQLTNTVNPEMHLALDALPDPYSLVENTYYENPNVFITSSFVGSQTGTDKLGRNYDFFFVTPKPQEYAQITWAVYGGDDKFYVCTSGWYDFDNTGTRYAINGYDLNGYFPVKWDAQSKPVNMEDQKGQLFSFKGIIHYDETATGGGSSVRRKYGEVSGEPPYLYKTNVTSVPYSISPVDINLTGGSIITSVEAVETVPAEVESVTYVDLTGRQSLRPFEGVNMVVTRYTDGTTKTQKVIR